MTTIRLDADDLADLHNGKVIECTGGPTIKIMLEIGAEYARPKCTDDRCKLCVLRKCECGKDAETDFHGVPYCYPCLESTI